MKLKVIAFDADDTLWVNEPFFRETEERFMDLFLDYLPPHTSARELLKTEIDNLPLYGYGIKGFILSMIETAMRISEKTISLDVIEKIIEEGKALLEKPVELIEGVEGVLASLQNQYRLVVATKGDLLDQHRKLHKSGLGHYFHHIEIMTEKKEEDFQKLLKRLDIVAEEFLMVGNSLKSDVLPVLNLGGHAVHVPFHITWEHEKIDHHIEHRNFYAASSLEELKFILEQIKKPA